MLAFFQYLSRISNYEINGTFIGQDPTNVIGKFIEATRFNNDHRLDISYKIQCEEQPEYYSFMELSTCSNDRSTMNAQLLVAPEDKSNK